MKKSAAGPTLSQSPPGRGRGDCSPPWKGGVGGGSDVRQTANSSGSRPLTTEIRCFRCGVCCVKWQPLLGPQELKRLAADLGVSIRTFKRRYTRPYPLRRGWHQLKAGPAGCVFLAYEGGQAHCSIHDVRPQVCREWMPSLEKAECLEGLKTLSGPPLLTLHDLYLAAQDRQRFIEAVTSGAF